MLTPIEEILEELRQGRMIILVDDEDRENEGDLVIAAEKATPESVNFMAKYGRGLICLALTPERIDFLGLPPMSRENRSRFGTAFHVSIEAAEGITTGISAFDRAHTIRVAVSPSSKPSDLVQPGHVFPLRAHEGGVLVRAGQTEGSVDLARLAGMNPSAVICEVMKDDGTMARLPELKQFGKEHGIKICTIADLIEYRRKNERVLRRIGSTRMPSEHGEYTLIAYESTADHADHLALVMGDVSGPEPVLVRVHSECLTGDVFGSQRCDCGSQLHTSLDMIAKEGRGVVVYMRQEGRGIGLANKIRAYALQDEGLDTVEANVHLGFQPDSREYGVAAEILSELGVKRVRIITNNPHKITGLSGHGVDITERVPLIIPPSASNERYMQTKREKLGHLFT
ncbi:MAG: riboflavin biosynthesis protein RibBA [Candidatus Hydrogenedentota bacterium]